MSQETAIHFHKRACEGGHRYKGKKAIQSILMEDAIYPLARWWHKSSLVDKGCHSEDCTCLVNAKRNYDERVFRFELEQ